MLVAHATLLVIIGWLTVPGSSVMSQHSASPPPGYRHTAFRLVVPQRAIDEGTLHWHDALRHAAFLSMRRTISSSDGNAARAETSLWQRLSSAHVSPRELAKPVYEDADITTLASGVLIREAGRLSFVPEAALLENPGNEPFKVAALWSVLRVRHSGPGLEAPRVEYYFTVHPASHLSIINHVEKQRDKIVFKKVNPKPKPTYFYKEVLPGGSKVPVYGNVPGEYYNPQFISLYRDTIQKFNLKPEEQEAESIPSEDDRRSQEPYYILPAPRYQQYPPNFPRVSQLVRPQHQVPKLVNIFIPRQTASNLVQVTTPRFNLQTTSARPSLSSLRRKILPRVSGPSSEDLEEQEDGMVEVPTIQMSPNRGRVRFPGVKSQNRRQSVVKSSSNSTVRPDSVSSTTVSPPVKTTTISSQTTSLPDTTTVTSDDVITTTIMP